MFYVKGKYKVILLFFNLSSQGTITANFALCAPVNKDYIYYSAAGFLNESTPSCSWRSILFQDQGGKGTAQMGLPHTQSPGLLFLAGLGTQFPQCQKRQQALTDTVYTQMFV